MSSNTAAANRRVSPRRRPKNGAKVSCQKGSLGLGPNLALSVVDVSETGMRLILKSPREKGQVVEINLTVPGHPRPVKLPAVIVWSVPEPGGSCRVGARFQRSLNYRDLLQIAALGS